MVGVMIVPTGLGCSIGGHAGDATPAARLLAQACDILIVHPNVVNASDICEMTENMLYVEGSTLDGFLEGKHALRRVNSNRILVVANKPVSADTVNAVNAARHTLGIDATILGLDTPLTMRGLYALNGEATGEVEGWSELVDQLSDDSVPDFDALAIHSPIDVPRDVALQYLREGGVNPWGGVEAIASRRIANQLGVPVAHSPVECIQPDDDELYFYMDREEVDPRMAAELVSKCYLHCVLKGLHKAPRIAETRSDMKRRTDLDVRDVDVLISPYGCWGRPHKACLRHDIPIIIVEENRTCLKCMVAEGKGVMIVENYLEAAGAISAMRAGVSLALVRERTK